MSSNNHSALGIVVDPNVTDVSHHGFRPWSCCWYCRRNGELHDSVQGRVGNTS